MHNSSEKKSPDAADRIGTEPVGRLLLRFSLPAITGMLVNALYNVVDRIFVGRFINEVALGGLSLVMPLMIIAMAFAMLFGVGSANLISMRLGQGRREEAEKALSHCLLLLTGVGFVLMAAGLIFIDPILSLMGAQPGSESLYYARGYLRVTLFGAVFMQIGFGLSHCTRAQGFPLITMAGMLLGAILNIILDAVFILVFGWGVEGVALATVISQFCSFVWIFSFSCSKKAVVRLSLANVKAALFKPSIKLIGEIMSFGSPQFAMQFIGSVVLIIFNTILSRLGPGALGVSNGGDIALSGMNIVNSISMLILMPVIGINQGAQPILGYNYGAKKFSRVREAYLRAIFAASCICISGFILIQSFPLAITMFFVPEGSAAFVHFTPLAMRIFKLSLPLTGFLIISSHLFVVTGRPKISTLLNTLRQCIILIPCALILGNIWGLWGFIAALPVTEGISLIITGFFIFREMKKLKSLIQTEKAVLEPVRNAVGSAE